MEGYNLTQTGQEVQDILNNATPHSELTTEVERAQEAERVLGEGVQQNADDIDAIEAKIPSAASSENKLTDKEYVDGQVDNEKTRAQGAEDTLQDNIGAEELRAKAAEEANANDIDAIEAKIPSGASSENKLATESYVNDAVSTASATFRGTFNLVSDLHLTLEATHANIATALAAAIATADNNDFAFVLVPTDEETPTVIGSIDRYKFNGEVWAYEYTLNNSGFTQEQWDAINSGITSGDVTKLGALPTNAELTLLLNGLAGDIGDEETRAKAAELALQGAIGDEETRAKAAEKANADDIDAIEEKIPSSASSSNKLATASDVDNLSAAIEAILLLIPSAASALNQLADKAFVNSSISTATATFRGTFNLVSDLHLTLVATHAQIETALGGAIPAADNSDYCFVQIPTSADTPTEIAKTERYKFNGSEWAYEYDLNNSGYTAVQWAAINSGITQALVSKLSALPTNADLTTALGVLTTGIETINEKIPTAASISNKMVDTAAMVSYVTQIIEALDMTFNVTSEGGHVTLQIRQEDGAIVSVAVSTTDIASELALNVVRDRVTAAEGNIITLTGRVSINERDIALLQDAYAALTQSEPVIIQKTDTWPVAHPETKVIYRVVDRVNTPPQYYSDYMWNGTTMVLMATYNNAIDDVPTSGSNNLVKSGGVFNELALGAVYDVTAHNSGATFASLEALLNDDNLSTLIPTAVRKGGMSIKFVQSPDNKYVQYRLMADDWSTNESDWAICSDTVLVENPEFVKVETDKDGRILWAIKTDGTIYFGASVPPQIREYIENKLGSFDAETYGDIESFLGSLIEGDKTLSQLLEGKVDTVEGKGLSTNDYTNKDKEIVDTESIVENPEYLAADLDADEKFLGGYNKKGKRVYPTQQMDDIEANREKILSETVDSEDYIIEYNDNEGKKHLPIPTNQDDILHGEIYSVKDEVSKVNFIDIRSDNFNYRQECIFHDNFCREIKDELRPWLIGSNSDVFTGSNDKYAYRSLYDEDVDDGFRITTDGTSETSSNERLTNVLSLKKGFRIVKELVANNNIVVEIANPNEEAKYQSLAFNIKNSENYELFRICRYGRLYIEKVNCIDGVENRVFIIPLNNQYGNAIRFYFVDKFYRIYLDDSPVYNGVLDNSIYNIGLMIERTRSYSYHFFNIYHVDKSVWVSDTTPVVDKSLERPNGVIRSGGGQAGSVDPDNEYAYHIVSDVVGYGKCERFEIRYYEGLTYLTDREENTFIPIYIPLYCKYAVSFDFMVPADFVGDNYDETIFQLHESNASYQGPCNYLSINKSTVDNTKWVIYIGIRSIIEQVIAQSMPYKCEQYGDVCYVEPGKWHHFDLFFKPGYIPEHNPLTIVKVDNVEVFRSACPNAYNVCKPDFPKYGIYKAVWMNIQTNTTRRVVYFDNVKLTY